MAAKLIVDIPSLNWACTYLLDEEKVQSAGRGKHNAIEVPDIGTSDRHAEFYWSLGNWHVRDVGGEGGLKVNGRIVQEAPLEHGAQISIGNSELAFEVEEEELEEDWKRTSDVITNASARAREALGADASENGTEERNGNLPIPPLSAPLSAGAAPIKPKLLQPLHKRSGAGSGGESEPADDNLWVSRKIASMLDDVLARPASLEFVLQRMLMRLRETVGADYGFLMLPEAESKRWVIRTQVGNAFSWSGYERAHPVPLTVANAAFTKKCAVSNAIEDDDNIEDVVPSESMLALQVNGYIAVPLIKDGEVRGVLYFDTRNPAKEFRARDVKLLQQAGSTIVEIEESKLRSRGK